MSSSYGYALDPGFKAMLASVGVRHQDVLRRAGLPEDLLNRSNVRVPANQFFAFTQALERSVNDPLLSIRLVREMSAESFSPPMFAALCSPNLRVAVARLALFKPLIAPLRLEVETRPAGLWVGFDWSVDAHGPPPFLVAFEALFLVKLARMGTRDEVRAIEVTLPELPSPREPYESFLGCRIQPGDRSSITFSSEDAERPFLTDHSAMWEIFEPELRRRLADLEATASFQARTRAVLIEALPSGQVSVESIARRLAMSPRTLQRRLRREGTTFKEVVGETRKSLALHYLGQTQLSYGEIAYLLGFKEPNSFFRAFQSWTGTTPESQRRMLQPAV